MPVFTIVNKPDEFLMRFVCACGELIETTEKPPTGMEAFFCPSCGQQWEMCADCLKAGEGTTSYSHPPG